MAEFIPAVEYALENEGGYCNVEHDPGGETNFGICKRDHPDLDIASLTKEQAEAIYRDQYWLYDGIQNQGVASKLLDMAVNMEGTGHRGKAIWIIQEAASKQVTLLADGAYGPTTEAAINRCNPAQLLTAMCDGALRHHRSLIAKNARLAKFKKGWERRDLKLPRAAKGASA